MYQKWIDVLTKPKSAFAKEIKRGGLVEGAKHIIVGGLIAGLISGLVLLALGSAAGSLLEGILGAYVGIIGFVASLILTPIIGLISWIVGSGIVYVFALIFGGKGSFERQSYLIALYTAPVMIITAVIGLVPVAGAFINFLIGLYTLYLLTVALKLIHRFSIGKAVLSWLVPSIIVGIVMAAVASIFLMTMISALA